MTTSPRPPDPARSRLRVGSFTPSVLLAVARSTGALDRAGISVEEHAVTSSPAQFAALRDGELDVALTSPDNVLAYRFSPSNPLGSLLDVAIVAGIDRGLGLGLYGRPGTTTAQLRGAVVGVDVPTSGFALALYALADSLGVARDEYHLEALGSTPRRLEALLDGRCGATMLNAGNELRAEAAGCPRLASVTEVCGAYLGTVVAVLGTDHLAGARALSDVLSAVATEILEGQHTGAVVAGAGEVLGLPEELGRRYAERLRDPQEGLTAGLVDRDSLSTLVSLRRRYLPEVVAGQDPLEAALAPTSGLVVRPEAGGLPS